MCQSLKNKILLIRERMRKEDLNHLIIPQSDPHLSEYLADHWKVISWCSGFTGSAGTVVISMNHVGLWTDSRYFIQARNELKDTPIELHEVHDTKTTYRKWLYNILREGDRVGMDGSLFSMKEVRELKKMIHGENANMVTDFTGHYDSWDLRPALPSAKIFEFDVRYAGMPRKDKLSRIREEMRQSDVEWHLLTMLDDVAWTLNLRGKDVPYNPVFYGFCLIGHEETYLMVDTEKISNVLVRELERDGVFVAPYRKAYDLRVMVDEQILIDPALCNSQIFQQFDKKLVREGKSIPSTMKACKQKVEIMHIRDSMVKDGIALTHAFKWLEDTLKGRTVSEYEFSRKIIECRSNREGYFGESFPAIIGYNANGAIVHYRPPENGSADIRPEGILLCDTGGQYIDGTTDITRTIALSDPSNEVRRDFTLVLKGHIALDKVRFPRGTAGVQLDTLARQFLWSDGKNYGHGTGHGVGYFLNVHEGPQGYSYGTSGRAVTVLKEGMLSSNEPGFYKEGYYGIRLENLLLVVSDEQKGYLRHEHMTLFPFDASLIQLDLLTLEEKHWINDYHVEVYERLAPHLDDDHKAWLREKCVSI